MKKFYWLLVCCWLTAMFSACSDEDKETGGENQGGDDKGKNEQTEVRKIKRLTEIRNENAPGEDLISFEYTDQGIKGVNYGDYHYNDGTILKLDFTSSGVKVRNSEDKSVSSIDLEEGKPVQARCNVRESDVIRYDYDSCYCFYENDCLKQIRIRNYYQTPYGDDGQPALYITDSRYDFTFKAGLLEEEKYTEERENRYTLKYAYSGTIRNDANVDLSVFLAEWLINWSGGHWFNDDILCLRLFGLVGNQTKYLPSEMTYSKENSTTTWQFAYKTDQEGYATEISVKEKESGEEYKLNVEY